MLSQHQIFDEELCLYMPDMRTLTGMVNVKTDITQDISLLPLLVYVHPTVIALIEVNREAHTFSSCAPGFLVNLSLQIQGPFKYFLKFVP